MAVVAHHPVVVPLKGITVCGGAIDNYLSVFYLQVILLINPDRTLIYGNIVEGKIN